MQIGGGGGSGRANRTGRTGKLSQRGASAPRTAGKAKAAVAKDRYDKMIGIQLMDAFVPAAVPAAKGMLKLADRLGDAWLKEQRKLPEQWKEEDAQRKRGIARNIKG